MRKSRWPLRALMRRLKKVWPKEYSGASKHFSIIVSTDRFGFMALALIPLSVGQVRLDSFGMVEASKQIQYGDAPQIQTPLSPFPHLSPLSPPSALPPLSSGVLLAISKNLWAVRSLTVGGGPDEATPDVGRRKPAQPTNFLIFSGGI